MSSQNIPQEATKLKKSSKSTAGYMEMEEFSRYCITGFS
jgi:hypothetical protein